MAKHLEVQPFLKWAGGKRQLLPEIRKYIPKKIHTYYEPFVGAGAVLFDLQPERAVINDINAELINVYRVIKNNVEELINRLKQHEERHSKQYFYEVRHWDRLSEYRLLSEVERAARIIYLNRTCFNGLYRVNSKGQFNVPFGRYQHPQIVNEPVLRAAHDYLSTNQVTMLNVDFEEAVHGAKKGDFVYLDPPYDPISVTSSFTSYNLDGFTREDQVRLKELFVDLDQRGVHVLLSNSATDFILDLYRDYRVEIVTANRAINSKAEGRGKIAEVLVRNW